MTDQFVERMELQRKVLRVVNDKFVGAEQLCGLSADAIARWARGQHLSDQDPIVQSLRSVARELMFFATKSQEGVSEEYRSRQEEVFRLIQQLMNTVQQAALADAAPSALRS